MGSSRSVGVLVKEARSLLAELNQADLTGLTDGEVTELVTVSAEVMKLAEAGLVWAAGRLDVTRAWEPDGARGAAAWLGWQCHLAPAAPAATTTAGTTDTTDHRRRGPDQLALHPDPDD